MKQHPVVRQCALGGMTLVLMVLLDMLWVRPTLVDGLTRQDLPARRGSYTLYFPIVWTRVRSEPNTLIDPNVQAARLGRGINLGNALEAPREGEWGDTWPEDFFPIIAEAGFDTVRVPIRWSAHAMDELPYTIDEPFFERVDWVIDNAMAYGLNVVITMHHYQAIVEAPGQHEARFLAMWRQIASRYGDRPDSLYLELLNEPHQGLSADRWNDLLVKTIAVVREVDGVHTLIVDSTEWASAHALAELELPDVADETNVICSFHLDEDNPAAPAAALRELDQAVAFGKELNCPLWLGEFAAYHKADTGSRVNWTAFVRREAEKRGLSWAYWEFCAESGVYDREQQVWRKELLNALIPAD